MKEVMKIYLSNWINLLAIFMVVYIAVFISALVNDKFTVSEALVGTALAVILYGMIFWVGFSICMLILDIVIFSFFKEKQYVTVKLMLEWLVISAPFIYWLLKYSQWIFLFAILSFLLGQYLRRPYILKILKQ